MTEILEIRSRPLWGDYGTTLSQGVFDKASLSYRGFAPLSPIVHPSNYLLCNNVGRKLLATLPESSLFQCKTVELLEFDWRAYPPTPEPPFYPPGGEPDNYFSAGLDSAAYEPLWVFIPKETVLLQRPSMEEMQQSIMETCTVPRPKLPRDKQLPRSPIFAGRYDHSAANVAYYIQANFFRLNKKIFEHALECVPC